MSLGEFLPFDPREGVQVKTGAALPHWTQVGRTAFVTWRTADSIPRKVLESFREDRAGWLESRGIDVSESGWRDRVSALPSDKRKEYWREFGNRWLDLLDEGLGSCPLRRPDCANTVAKALRHFDGERYQLGDFVIMPNHVHVLVTPTEPWTIWKICWSWKKFSATRINELLGTEGRFWQSESFDHLVRDIHSLRAFQR